MAQAIDVPAILTELGDDYKDSKLLDGVADTTALAKRFMDTKVAYDTKQEGVIQKPGEDATDEQKAEYESALKKELGAGESLNDYTLPDTGVERSEELIQAIKQAYLDEGISPAAATRMIEKLDGVYTASQKAAAEAAEVEYQNDVKDYQKEHPGDTATTAPRMALKAMLQFAGKHNPALAKSIIDSKILDTPNDFAALRKIGISPAQLRTWEPIAEAMQSDKAITNEGTPTPGTQSGPEPGSKEARLASRYDHPTSVADRKARGAKY